MFGRPNRLYYNHPNPLPFKIRHQVAVELTADHDRPDLPIGTILGHKEPGVGEDLTQREIGAVRFDLYDPVPASHSSNNVNTLTTDTSSNTPIQIRSPGSHLHSFSNVYIIPDSFNRNDRTCQVRGPDIDVFRHHVRVMRHYYRLLPGPEISQSGTSLGMDETTARTATASVTAMSADVSITNRRPAVIMNCRNRVTDINS